MDEFDGDDSPKSPKRLGGRRGGHPRQRNPFRRQEIERAAVEKVTVHFEKDGYDVDSVEKDNVGWDLNAVRGKTTLRLEVKGLSDTEICFDLTPNEYEKMKELRNEYQICVVTNALTNPNPQPTIFAYSGKSELWESRDRGTLEIEEIIAARCRAPGP